MLKLITLTASLCVAAMLQPAFAAGTETTPEADAQDKNYVAGKKAIDAKNWNAAIVSFKKVIAADAGNADAHNYLGYAYRWTNKMDDSFKHYGIALKIDPAHRGAHEYVGQAYLKVGQPEKANEHLAKLEKICGLKCEEYLDLAKAVTAFEAAKK
jgi:tetratricopeptide (TPR) repeat protein